MSIVDFCCVDFMGGILLCLLKPDFAVKNKKKRSRIYYIKTGIFLKFEKNAETARKIAFCPTFIISAPAVDCFVNNFIIRSEPAILRSDSKEKIYHNLRQTCFFSQILGCPSLNS